MEIQYHCRNENCRPDDGKPFVLTISIDDIMDEKNLAQMYCPHCTFELEPEKPTE